MHLFNFSIPICVMETLLIFVMPTDVVNVAVLIASCEMKIAVLNLTEIVDIELMNLLLTLYSWNY